MNKDLQRPERWSVADGDTIRSTNTSVVFDHIYSNRRTDRASIARDTGLSPTTVSAITGNLLEAGVIRESGSGASRGGRRPIVLEIVPGARLSIGVEVGASHITVIVLDLFGTVISRSSQPILTANAGVESVEMIKSMLEGILAELPTASRVAGIGVGIQSRVARPGWKGIDLDAELRDSFGIPLWIDNDANLGALAEAWWGQGQDVADFTYVKLGGGVGSGHIIAGDIHRGHSGAAGEIGHTPSEPGGRLCQCGRRGCLEAYISSRTLVEFYLDECDDCESTGTHTTDRRLLIEAANRGEEPARRIVSDAGKRLGAALSTVIGILAPAMIVLSGPITAASDFMEAVKTQIEELAFEQSAEVCKLVISELDQDAGAVGAATLVISEVFRHGVTESDATSQTIKVSG
ncbi:MAG: ROK family transcriptional regulator [Actinomycetota bacterium]